MQNESERKRMMCPHWKEQCLDGYCRSMGENKDTGERPVCRWWVHVVGKDPQSDKTLDWFDCSIAWLPTLQIETAQTVRQGNAGLDKTANVIFNALDQKTQQRILINGTDRVEPKLLEEK